MENADYIIDFLHNGVRYGESLGADFLEIRYDGLKTTTINNTNAVIKDTLTQDRTGVGIIAYHQGSEGFCFTPEITQDKINHAVATAVNMAKASANLSKLKLPFPKRPAIKKTILPQCKIHPKDVEFAEKLEYLNRVTSSINEQMQVNSTTALYGELYGDKLFVNSDGSEIEWHPILVDIAAIVVAADEQGRPAVSMYRKAACKGVEIYADPKSSPEFIGKTVGTYCKEQVKAKPIKSGKYRALIGPVLAGVLAHESFGHLSEADSIVNGNSPITGKIDQQLGTEYATIFDAGIVEDAWGYYLPFDDQGIPANKTVLLDKGILKGYLHSRGTATKMNMGLTGNNRALHFMFPPIPRMTNTCFAGGDLTHEEALEQLKTGVYALDSMGGQVSDDGNFLFQCSRGYFVENGEISHPIRDSSLSGDILKFLNQINGATKDIEFMTGYFGGCGKKGQSPLPVGMGAPEILVGEVLIGGN